MPTLSASSIVMTLRMRTERLGAAGVVGREVAVGAVSLAQMVEKADRAAGVVRDLLEDVGNRIDAGVGVLIHSMQGDERIEDRDADLLAPDRRNEGVAQPGIEHHAALSLDRQAERVVEAGVEEEP